jgi:hypothetical protein
VVHELREWRLYAAIGCDSERRKTLEQKVSIPLLNDDKPEKVATGLSPFPLINFTPT